MINVVLVDDNLRILSVIEMMINAETDMHVAGIARSGAEALELVKKIKPDVLVTDVIMNVMDGIQLTREVISVAPHVKVIAFSMHNTTIYIQQALEAGASGYVLKGKAGTDLVPAINSVMSGKIFLSHSLTEKWFTKCIKET
jgi:DNA-binding NarL/FixJ family response regulator